MSKTGAELIAEERQRQIDEEKRLRARATQLRLHSIEITDDLMWDIADGLRISPEKALDAHTIEVAVRDVAGDIVWRRSDFLKKEEE